MRGACPPLTWWPSAEAAADPGRGGSSPRQCTATQGRRDAAENVREQRRRPVGGAALLGGLGGWVSRCRQRPRGSSGGGGTHERRPGVAAPPPPPPLVGGRKGQLPPPRPIAVAPHPLSPPGQPGGQAPGASWAWGRLAPMPRRGGYPASWVVPCTGVPPGGLSSGGPGRPGGPAPARRTMRPPLRAGPQGRAPGVPARPGAGLSDSVGPPRGHVAVVACPATAADAPAQASAPGT